MNAVIPRFPLLALAVVWEDFTHSDRFLLRSTRSVVECVIFVLIIVVVTSASPADGKESSQPIPNGSLLGIPLFQTIQENVAELVVRDW